MSTDINTTTNLNQDLNDVLKLIDSLKSQLRKMVNEMQNNENLTDESLEQYGLKVENISIQLSALSQIVLTTNIISDSLRDVKNNETARMMKLYR